MHMHTHPFARPLYSLCLAVVERVNRQPNDVGEDGNHHPIVAAVGRQYERRRLCCPAADAGAGARRTHYARAYVRRIDGGRLEMPLLLMAADADGSVAAARLFVPQISTSVGVPLHAVQLLTGGRQLAPLWTGRWAGRPDDRVVWVGWGLGKCGNRTQISCVCMCIVVDERNTESEIKSKVIDGRH